MSFLIKRINRLFRHPLFITCALLLLAIFFVDYRGDFAVNDDWIFVRQIEAFFKEGWKISFIIDPAFIAQGLFGYGWAMLFGVGFVKMRILTLLLTFVLVAVVYKILNFLGTKSKLQFAVLMLVAFNPLLFTSAFSFMTEIYFLLFYMLGILYYLRHFKNEDSLSLFLGSVFTCLAILVRQVGIVPFIAYLVVAFYTKRLNLKRLIVALAPIIFSFWAFSVWPRYLGESVTGSFEALASHIIDLSDIWERLYRMLLSLPYFAFFVLPLFFLNKKESLRSRPLWVKILAIIAFVYIAEALFGFDIFPVGGVFYVEGLHAKSNYRAYFNIFDNVVFKYILSTLISLGIVRFFLLFKKRNKLDPTSVFLLLNVLGSFAILMFGDDYYDRYLLPSGISFLLLLVYYFKDRIDFETRFQWGVLVLIVVMAVLHQHEYFSHTRLRWKQAIYLQHDTGYVNSIFVDGTYGKYFAAKKVKDYTGGVSGDLPGEYKCYVLKYTLDTDMPLFGAATWIDQITKRYIGNPEIYNAKRNRKIPSIKKRLDELSYNEEYFSPIFNFIGKRAYVGSWCDEK